MAEVEEIDFSPYFSEDYAEEYAQEFLEDLVEGRNLEPAVSGHTYVRRPDSWLGRFMPGSTDFAASAENGKLRYNTEYINSEEVDEMVEQRTDQARQEFTSWKAVSSELE